MKSSLKFARILLLSFSLILASNTPLVRAEIIYWPLTALDLARQRAASVSCVSNLKRIVLAARLSSLESGPFPLSILSFTNELESPAVLFCPADVSHQVPTNWDGFDSSEIDYEWIPQTGWDNPAAVCCQCRIHNNVAHVDGSVWPLGGYRRGWPAIVAPPLGQDVTPGSQVRFEVILAPDALRPISYQWQRGQLDWVTNVTFVGDPEDPDSGFWKTNRQGVFTNSALSGETNSTYVIAGARTNDSGYYSVVASNALGATASNPSRLVVEPSVSEMATNHYWSAINCVNNLKQIALFGRMQANDQDEQMPQSFSAMTNAYGAPIFGWPVVLYCRFDTARTVPADWAALDMADTSYEILPSDVEDIEAAFCRCKVHGFYAKVDGSVVSEPHFARIRRLPHDTTELNFTIFAGQANVLEVSSDLIAWVALSRYPSTNGNFSFSDTHSSPQRFYRIRTQE